MSDADLRREGLVRPAGLAAHGQGPGASNDLPLPPGWCRAKLSDLIEQTSSTDPTRMPSTTISYIDIGAIDSATGRIIAPKRLQSTEAPSRARQAVRQGDVLFSTVRPYLRAIALMPALENPVASTGFCVVRPAAGIDSRYVHHCLRSDAFVEQVLPLQRGSSYPAVRDQDVLAQSIALPPVREQKRVADAIDELFSDIEVGVAELQAAQLKLTRYRQSLLKSAVEGTLTAEWRAQNPVQETGADLLARILQERRARWEARQVEQFAARGKTPPKDWQASYVDPAPLGTVPAVDLPMPWTFSSIGQCFHVAVGATPSRKAADYWGGTIPWVSSGEVRFARISETRETITELGLKNSSTQINPVGSVLLGMIGEGKTRGQVAILDVEAANNQNCAALWVSETEIPPEFVFYWLWSRYDETRRGSSGNNQPALNKSLIAAMPLALPPLAEAREIVSRVGLQLDGIEAQEREIAHLLRLAAAQRQNILRAAFSGRLVPQDPTDEPARVLLEHIRAGRDSAPKVRAARKKALSSRPCTPAQGPATC